MIDFSPYLMGGFFVIFVALMIFLNFILFKPMFAHLDARKAHLTGDQGAADKDIQTANDLKNEAEATILRAKQEAHRIKDEAQKEAKTLADAAIAQAQAAIATEMAQFEMTLQEEEKSLKNALLGEAPLFKERIRTKFVAA